MKWLNLIIEFLKYLLTPSQEPPRENVESSTDRQSVIDPPKPDTKPQAPINKPDVSEPENGKLLWCPFAIKRKEKMTTQGKYRNSYPEGAVIHFTAGSSAEASFQYGVKKGYCFFVIAENGDIHQAFPLDRWGYHAGVSRHKTLGSGVSKYLVGIEIANAGKLSKKSDGSYETWFGSKVDAKNVRHYPKKTKNIEAGYYACFTKDQEVSLRRLIKWLKSNNPEVFKYELILGHDEVSPGRKNDPGGSLSMTMEDFRSSFS